MKKNLTRALASYSGLASSILLLTNNSTNAQIVYVDPPDITLHNGELNLDLDNNGLVDFNIRAIDYNANYFDPEILQISGDLNDFILGPRDPDCTASYSERPMIVRYGQEIKAHALWVEASSYAGIFCFSEQKCNHLWSGRDHKFVGIRFAEDNSHRHVKHYGWIRVSISSDCSSITIHDWAYNSVANQPIMAGQTSRMANGEIENALEIFSYDNIVHIQNNFSNNDLNVEIFNNLGQLIKSEKTSEENSVLEINDLASGIYFVKVASNTEQTTKEIFIE